MLLNFVEIGSWGLELNFLGFQIEENFWEAKFLGIYLKLKLTKNIFPQNHPRPQKILKNVQVLIFLQIFHSLWLVR